MIELKELSVTYPDGTKALDKVSFTVLPGEKTALIGANGAGKSTLLSTLAGIMQPEGGRALIDGIPLEKKNLTVLRSKVGLVFSNPDDQLFMPNVWEDIAFGLRSYRIPDAEVRERVDRILSDLGIEDLAVRMTHRLSAGEKRSAAIAGILVMEPSVLLLDEPSSSLDPGARRKLMETIRRLPVTMLIATHDLSLAMEICERAVILKEGQVFAIGRAVEILSDEAVMEACGLEVPHCCKRESAAGGASRDESTEGATREGKALVASSRNEKQFRTKIIKLKELLQGYGRLAVAFSGGVDSTFLLSFARSVLGKDRVLAISAASPVCPAIELRDREIFCKENQIRHLSISLELSEIPGILENPADRCYQCKRSVFGKLKELAIKEGFPILADGTNQDDLSDYRPGLKALSELQVESPLLFCGFTKEDIRQGLRDMGLSIWNKPACACLATRIPHGEAITEEKLRAVDQVEMELHKLGFSQVRVRHHGTVARIEVALEDRLRFMDPELLAQADRIVREAGFLYGALDLTGYRMGKMNPVNPVNLVNPVNRVNQEGSIGNQDQAAKETG